MELINPWKIEIGRINLLDRVDNKAISDETHVLHCLCPRDSKTPLEITVEQFPTLVKFRDEVLTPLVVKYIQDVFGVNPTDITVDTFGKMFYNQEGLASHLHGNSCITTVYYPEDTKAGMLLTDPRFNASRGYPRPVRDNHFGDFYVAPKAGDLWIVPSYIQHSVEANPEDMRLSLINDFNFKA